MGAVGRHIGLRFAWSDTMNDHDTTENDRDQLTRDEVFELFNNPRRRYVLYLLEEEPDGMSIGDLTDEVTAWEEESTVENLTQQQRKRVYVSLYQTHVPKLEDAGFVDHDQDTGMVELRSRAREVNQFLGEETSSFPWPYIYLPLAFVGLALVLLRNFNVWVFGELSESGLAVALVVGLVLTAAVHAVIWLWSDSGTLMEFQEE